MATNALPTPEAFAQLLALLVGKKPRVAKSQALLPSAVRGLATYADASGKLLFAAATDIAFLASTGAALAMIPVGVVQEALKAGRPNEALLENAYEVLNVGASLFNEIPGTELHVKIAKLFVAPEVPRELLQRMIKPAARIDIEVGIPGYPDGKITLLSLA